MALLKCVGFTRYLRRLHLIEQNSLFRRIEHVRLCSDNSPTTVSPTVKHRQDDDFDGIFVKKLLTDSKIYKGLSFSREERDRLRLRGVLPHAVFSMETQLEQFKTLLNITDESGVIRFLVAMSIYDLNKKLFFRFVEENFDKILHILYTPFISEVCNEYSFIFNRPRCLYISIHDKGKVKSILRNWPRKNIRLVIVTDGEKVSGHGDLGVNGAPVCIAKRVLYTAASGISPHETLPITIDVGTNNEAYLKDRLYTGLRQRRVTGEVYDQLMDEFMYSIREVFGPRTVIHLENFGANNSLRLLQKYENDYCCLSNDIQSIAATVLCGIFVGAKIMKKNLCDLKFVFFGAGQCNLGIGRLLKIKLREHGFTKEEIIKNFYYMDSKGLVIKNREWDPSDVKLPFARDLEPLPDLISIVKKYKPDVLIGASSSRGAFTKEVLETMANQVELPLIFAVSNPLQKCECTAEEAVKYTEGRCIFVSTFPFEPVHYKGKIHCTSQANTFYINMLAMTASLAGIKSITDDLLIEAACALEECVTQEDMDRRLIYPANYKVKEVAKHIIPEMMEYAYDNKLATVFPEPKDKEQYYLSNVYQTNYYDMGFYEKLYETTKRSRMKQTKV